MKRIAIIGASGHGKVVADIAKLNGYQDIIFLDDNIELKNCGSYEVKGTSKEAQAYAKEGYDIIVAIGNAKIRQRIQNDTEDKANIVSLIHPNAVISDDVQIGRGTVIMAGVVVNAGTTIGKGCIINTSSSVDHDNVIGDYAHISVGAHLAGTVKVGSRTWIGVGAVVSNNINICEDCMIGAGAVVVKSITDNGKYLGVPAKWGGYTRLGMCLCHPEEVAA